MSLSVTTIQQRWRETGGKDPIFAPIDGMNCPHLPHNGVAAVKQLSDDSRKHADNLRFDAWQQTNRPNHFTVVEAWADRKAYEGHVQAAHTRQFRDKLGPMSGALYDERLYKWLD